jgi:hypothetical protein
MLLPSMTLQEIRTSLLKDLKEGLKNKVVHSQLSMERRFHESGSQLMVETVPYLSRQHNLWRIACRKDATSSYYQPYMMAYDHVGVIAMHFPNTFNPEVMMYFNTHFFKRYRERAELDIERPSHLVKHFFKQNNVLLPCYYPQDDGSLQLFSPVHGGLGLGYFHADTMICEFKTFVSYDMLRIDQIIDISRIYQATLQGMKMGYHHSQMLFNLPDLFRAFDALQNKAA